MGFVVRVQPKDVVKTAEVRTLWDWDSFKWGFTIGGICVVAAGGIILYFTWPFIISMMKTIPLFGAVVEEAKGRGLI